MSIFDDIIKAAPAEDRAVLDKYPTLRASMEKLEGDLGSVSKYAGEWMSWQNRNWDPDRNMTRAEAALRDELDAANARLADAGTGNGSGIDVAALEVLKKELIAQINAARTETAAAFEGRDRFYTAVTARSVQHQQEFGEYLDPVKYREYMRTTGINDPDLAYDRWVSDRRAGIASQRQQELETRHKTELEEAEKRGYEKRAQEAAMGPSGVLPTDNTGGIAGITAHTATKPATVSEEAKALLAGAKLGDGTAGDIGYKMFLRGELPTQ
jgi:hypothetical protein